MNMKHLAQWLAHSKHLLNVLSHFVLNPEFQKMKELLKSCSSFLNYLDWRHSSS